LVVDFIPQKFVVCYRD